MKILAIDTSCDETAVAITSGRRVLSHLEYTQIQTHKKWGGVVPSIAKRAHAEKIDYAVESAVSKAKKIDPNISLANIDAIAVTVGPGLAIALEVGILQAKKLAAEYKKPLIPINHMEGHIYSCFAENSKGLPKREFLFPYLAFLVSGGHTELVLVKSHLEYQIIGRTRDDAAGEALDKGARLLGLGYPGGAALERLAYVAHNTDEFRFPRPMLHSGDLDFSFSGLKTSLLYFLKKIAESEKNNKIHEIASSYQEAVFAALSKKAEIAIKSTGVKLLVCGGGVAANNRLRSLLRNLMKGVGGKAYFPPYKYLTGDNAAMIGIAAYYRWEKQMFARNMDVIDRAPRLSLENSINLI